MTKLRTPNSFEDAITRIMGVLTPSVAASAVGKSSDLLRRWGNEDLPERPSIEQCLLLDLAYMRDAPADQASVAPIFEVYAARLSQVGIAVKLQPLDPRDRMMRVASEIGDVSRAVTESMADRKVTNRERNAVRKEIREAIAELQRLDAEIEALP
jgi:hypothetical protein